MADDRTPLLLLGAGDMALTYFEEFADDPDYEIVGFVQDAAPELKGARLEGLPVLEAEAALCLRETHRVVNAVGAAKGRPFVGRFEAAGFTFATLVSPHAMIRSRAEIAPGCIVSYFAAIDPWVRLGAHTQVTSRVAVSHHTTVGSHTSLAPASTIGGRCVIGDRCFIGMGAIVRDNITIGDDATVGAGAVVIRDVEAGATVVGNPARVLGARSGAGF